MVIFLRHFNENSESMECPIFCLFYFWSLSTSYCSICLLHCSQTHMSASKRMQKSIWRMQNFQLLSLWHIRYRFRYSVLSFNCYCSAGQLYRYPLQWWSRGKHEMSHDHKFWSSILQDADGNGKIWVGSFVSKSGRDYQNSLHAQFEYRIKIRIKIEKRMASVVSNRLMKSFYMKFQNKKEKIILETTSARTIISKIKLVCWNMVMYLNNKNKFP